MPATLEAGTIYGYCVGEPWNQQAVFKGIGVPVTTNYDVWKNNPEKVISYAEKLTEGVKNSDLITVNTAPVEFKHDELAKAVNELEKSLDFELG